MKYELPFENLSNKEFIRFTSQEVLIDFLKTDYFVEVFDNKTKERIDYFNTSTYVIEKNQKNNYSFDYDVSKYPAGLIFIFTSNSSDDIFMIEGFIFPR